jgi:hypothetical protein
MEKRRGWIGEGPASAYSHLGKKEVDQIPQAQIIDDFIELLQAMPLTDEQVERLYKTICGRARHRVCARCKKLRITIDGNWEIHPSLDITKPKTFICKECK